MRHWLDHITKNLFFSVIAWVPMTLFLANGAAMAQDAPEIQIVITGDENVIVDENGDFTVPINTEIVWTVSVTISNPTPFSFSDVHWQHIYGGALEFRAVVASGGEPTYRSLGIPQGSVMHWVIGDLSPGNSFTIEFQLATRIDDQNGQPGEQMYTDLGCEGWDVAGVLHYTSADTGYNFIQLHPRMVCVQENIPWVEIDITSRKDWRIQRSGDYASEAFTLTVASNRGVSVHFDEFSDLVNQDEDAPPIAAYYSWGADLEEAHLRGWLSSSSLNGTTWNFPESDALEAGITQHVWSRMEVTPAHRSSDYEGSGAITVAPLNAKAFVDR